MKKQQPSIDGFVPRRAGARLGESQRPIDRPRSALGAVESSKADQFRPSRQLARTEIDDSLREIDDEDTQPQPKKRWFGRRRRKNTANSPSNRKKIIKRVILLLFLIGLAMVVYVGAKAFLASGNIFKGNPFDILQTQPLKQDENGRSNVLIFGTSEDDPEHPGGQLTDSIMVLSIDQTKKNAYMVSVPRDLYVKYGDTCPEGYQGKINSMYACYSNDGEDEAAGAAALQQKVGEVFGLKIQYYAHLNYTVVKDSVDAVGGVDVTIESNPKGEGILDRNFDWKCGYKCYYVKYDDGQVAHLDGEHALALARARGAAGGYGLAAANFDREKNQQKILKALREKAVGAGTLTNVGKVTGLIDALGNNLRTNFETKEIRTLMSLGTDVPSEKITSLNLVDTDNPLMTTGNAGGASIVRPVAGLFDYTDLQRFINKQLTSNEVTKEAAGVVVLNGSSVAGVGQKEADLLEAKGFTIAAVDNAPAGSYGDVEIYQIGEGKPATKAELKKLFGVTTIKTSNPPVAVAEGTNFVVVFGKDRSSTSQ